MGTRSGDLDPGILEYLHHKEGLSLAELDTMLNKQSGLLGVSGLTSDMRDLLAEEKAHGDRRARLAIDLFCLRARKAIGAMLARLNGAKAILFTGGIGENAASVRARILAEMDWTGIALDEARNEAMVGGAEGEIGDAGSRLRVFVIPTNEELIIARDTVRTVEGHS
jgi:acetate kinase